MSLELRAETGADGVRLLAPEAGLFTRALTRGTALSPGARAGVLQRLGRSDELLVPAGVVGIVTNERPELVLAPVGHSQVLYEVSPLGDGDTGRLAEGVEQNGAGLVLRATSSGRFYHRPAPDEPVFVEPGALLEEGTVVGLIEVMKTFAHVVYRPGSGLPARARLLRFLAGDGDDVAGGAALLELEDA
jgi:acetyl-CoA carboxylase biotin carboxyl carrier protein